MATIKTGSGRKRAQKKSAPKQKVRIIYREKECDKEHGSGGSSKDVYTLVSRVNDADTSTNGVCFLQKNGLPIFSPNLNIDAILKIKLTLGGKIYNIPFNHESGPGYHMLDGKIEELNLNFSLTAGAMSVGDGYNWLRVRSITDENTVYDVLSSENQINERSAPVIVKEDFSLEIVEG